MILKRKTKIFSRRDILRKEDELDNVFYDIKFNKLEVNIEYTKNYNDQYLTQPEQIRKQIKQMVKNIKTGYYYEDWLKDFSSKGKSHLMSKYINYSDRLNYRIYKPEIEMDQNGNPLPVQHIKIVLESCKGHNRNGVEKHYSKNEDSI
jgi:hypothetical protein